MATGTAKRHERKKLTTVMSETEQKLVEMVKQQKRLEKNQASTTATSTQRPRVKGKAKGPNPLSCKKRATNESKTENKRKRSRKS